MLPVPLESWATENSPVDTAKAGRFWEQIIFLRDDLPRAFGRSAKKFSQVVIATHQSSSVTLPVCQFKADWSKLTITVRGNFNDWKVSVNSETPVRASFLGLFDPFVNVHPTVCEGFPRDLVFGSYGANPNQFTIHLRNEYELYAFFLILGHDLGLR